MNNFYVYIYLDPRKSGQWQINNIQLTNEPFYVGKGKGRRAKSHLTMKSQHYKNNIIKKLLSLGLEPIVLKIEENLTEQIALDLEDKIIREIGTISPIEGVKSGPLTNLKLDGPIQIYSDDAKQKMSDAAKKRVRKPHSEETKQKMRDAVANRSPEEKKRLAEITSRIHKGKKLSEEQCKKLSKIHSGKVISDEQKKKISDFQSGRVKSAETCEKLSNVQKKEWEILKESEHTSFIVHDLKQWCSDNFINYSTFYSTLKRNKFHKGYKIISVSGGTH